MDTNTTKGPDGVWFVYGIDTMAYPIGLHDNETDALREALRKYGSVIFWPFGQEWDNIK